MGNRTRDFSNSKGGREMREGDEVPEEIKKIVVDKARWHRDEENMFRDAIVATITDEEIKDYKENGFRMPVGLL